MNIASMTGFARSEGRTDRCRWIWEAKSVNGRNLEVRCRLPTGFEALDPASRKQVGSLVRRGNVSLSLSVFWESGQQAARINTELLDRIIELLPDIRHRLPDAAPPSLDGLLGLRGVIEVQDALPEGEERERLDRELLASLEQTLGALAVHRREEGERLTTVLTQHVDRIAALCAQARQVAAAQPEAILARLNQQLEPLLTAIPALPLERLAQEAALLAVRADCREEMDRLDGHVAAARMLMATDKPIGRQFDFLCQELNREANTLCAKSADLELTGIGIDLKTTIDQLREQVQNIE